MAVCGSNNGAKQDKVLAHRGERRRQDRAIRNTHDFADFVLPHRYECAWNNTYNWTRDGCQSYCGLTGRDWDTYIKALTDPDDVWFNDPRYATWPPAWYVEMMRK